MRTLWTTVQMNCLKGLRWSPAICLKHPRPHFVENYSRAMILNFLTVTIRKKYALNAWWLSRHILVCMHVCVYIYVCVCLHIYTHIQNPPEIIFIFTAYYVLWYILFHILMIECWLCNLVKSYNDYFENSCTRFTQNIQIHLCDVKWHHPNRMGAHKIQWVGEGKNGSDLSWVVKGWVNVHWKRGQTWETALPTQREIIVGKHP